MRSIKLFKWKEPNPDPDSPGEEKEVDLVEVLKILINNRDPSRMPRGIDQYRFYGRMNKIFEEAKKTNVLKIEEADYTQVKKIMEEDVPAAWGMNKDISKAIEEFLNVEETK